MARTVRLRPLPLVLALAAAVPPAHARHVVGVTTRTFEKTSITTGAPRPLQTTIWYPAVPRTGTPEPLGRRDAVLVKRRLPLVIFSHGACGSPTESTYLTKALAAEGFVVAAMPHPGHTVADAECFTPATTLDTAANRIPDVRFTLDAMLALDADPTSPFGGRLDPNAIGIGGLSFGGFTTLLAGQQEPRFRAALVLVPGGASLLGPPDITIPTMVIGAERDKVVTFAESERAFELLAGPRFLVEVLGANHLSAVDDCFSVRLKASLCVADDISQKKAHRLILRYALPFFRRYLANARAASSALRRRVRGVNLTSDPG
jgi:predicted dienelactone hydrolase